MVGAGVSGLICARLLLRAGHDVVLVSADPLQQTTSHLAAAVWFPTAAGPPEAVTRWGAITYDVLGWKIPASTCRSATRCTREAARTFTRARRTASSAARLRSGAGTPSPTPPRRQRSSNGAP
ncbi:MAG: FAD-dependent oxidoreductase, partial [Streptosporangiaceae bacterium]